MKLRVAEPQDLADLSAFVNAAYRGDSSKIGWTTEADLLGGQRTDADSLLAEIKKTDSVILLLQNENRLVACVNLQRRGFIAYLGMLTVDPTLQAQGIGRQLLAMSENWVSQNWQTKVMEMNVIRQRKELIAWYVRRGYRLTDRLKPFPYDDERYGMPKIANLEFIVLEKSLMA